ncbi:MAG: ssDNA-binding domain-containing protein [Deferribacteraceae bacterium]|jgi:antirestriction protein ArdC/phage/plasmid primase-like uncharacterized protein|nr:ssDNA-binding domain-containing protein [Deferribacteraceae bacterium]
MNSWEKVDKHRQDLTNKIVEELEQGKIPWQHPWVTPYNPVTETVYKGANRLKLGFDSTKKGYDDPRWCTFHQAQQNGWKVKSGEKASSIEWWQWSKNEPVLDDKGQPKLDADGKQITQSVSLEKPVCKIYSVFNASQIEGMPPLEQKQLNTVETAERILSASGAQIEHNNGARAYYSPSDDKIVLPVRSYFISNEMYYGTALHELAHWTGHENRLNRDMSGVFGSEKYAKEELRAELASSFVNHELGTTRDTTNTAAYLQSWIQALKNDKNEIFKAAYDADKISDYIMEFGKEKTLNHEVSKASPENNNEKSGSLFYFSNLGVAETGFYVVCTKKEADIINEVIISPVNGHYTEVAPASAISNEEGFVRAVIDHSGVYYHEDRLKYDPISLFSELGDDRVFKGIDELLSRGFYKDNEKDWALRDKLQDKLNDVKTLNHEAAKAETLTHETPIKNISEKNACADIVINVPREIKDEAKALGAKWHAGQKTWYIPKGENINQFTKYLPEDGKLSALKDTPLFVSYSEKGNVKGVARWNEESRTWYLPAGEDIRKIPERYYEFHKQQEGPKKTFEEFAAEKGLIIEGQAVSDGHIHRVPVYEGKPKSKDGAYVLHDDQQGRAGYVQNFKTGETATFGERSVEIINSVNSDQLEAIKAERLAERNKTQDKTAKTVDYLVNNKFTPASKDNPYLQTKGVKANLAMADTEGTLIIPLKNINGELRSFQKICDDGRKNYISGGQKSGCFFTFSDENGLHVVKSRNQVIICEGFATGASIYEATNVPTVCAMDATNLKQVATEIRQKYGNDVNIIIAGDNDHKTPSNPGKYYAEKAAEAVGGKAVVPEFSKTEKEKGLTDFNDLQQSQGRAAVFKQLEKSLEEKNINQNRTQNREQER